MSAGFLNFRVLGTHPTPAADPGGDLTRDSAHGLFDPECTNHNLRLGTVERWTVRTDETMPAHSHPFHPHTNPVLLTQRNGGGATRALESVGRLVAFDGH
ncbi:multicopper oxidase domain-containing protein [Streptomyces fagopyri]|uniref:multicopper oxidase domain-containing protein n=1 Tax=Streptomyces fagopyri TaxID=2662397 RepID=UPI0038001C9D